MIDYIKFDIPQQYINLEQLENRVIEFNDFEFKPIYNQVNKVSFYICKDPLGFTLKRFNERLRFEGSLHKLYNRLNKKRGNHNDFNFDNLNFIIKWLEDALLCDSLNMRIRFIEIGLNLKMNFDIEVYLKNIKSFKKSKPFVQMPNNKDYGRECRLTQYKLKFYDKTFESDRHQGINTTSNLLRFEVVYNKMKPIGTIIQTLNDLQNNTKYKLIKEKLRRIFNQVEFGCVEMDTSKLKETDRMLYFAGFNETFWLDTKIALHDKYYNIRTKHKKISNLLLEESKKGFTNTLYELKEKFDNKIKTL